MSNEADLLRRAEELARRAKTWADLSNAIFDPVTGIVSREYPSRIAREAFAKTDEYRTICALVEDAKQRFGLVEGATPQSASRMVVRVPLSLQGALEREARAEGVSIDELVVAKLAVQLISAVPR